MKAVQGYISGQVQGVRFRETTREIAEQWGVCGWVRNLTDGRVEVWAEGDEDAVQALSLWLWTGSPRSSVAAVDLTAVEPEGFTAFQVRR